MRRRHVHAIWAVHGRMLARPSSSSVDDAAALTLEAPGSPANFFRMLLLTLACGPVRLPPGPFATGNGVLHIACLMSRVVCGKLPHTMMRWGESDCANYVGTHDGRTARKVARATAANSDNATLGSLPRMC